MKAEVKIPNGWRKLGSREIVREGDRFLQGGEWKKTTNPGLNAGWRTVLLTPLTYIRRKSPQQPRRKA